MPLARLIEHAGPVPESSTRIFYAMDDRPDRRAGRYGYFYGTIPLQPAGNPQTIPALEMNGAPLPVGHGAPLRLRVEAQLGFKMAKWIKGIEFAADTRDIGMGLGMGGWREDQQFYASAAGI